MRRGFPAALCALAALLCGCRAPAPKTSPAGPPRRIVSIAPSVTEILYAVGAGSRVVATDDYSNAPPEARRLPHVGGVSVNAEAVVASQPDLVVGVQDLQAATLHRLSRLGLRTLALDTTSYQKTIDAIRLLGREVGSEPDAETAARRLEDARIRARAGWTQRPPLVLFVAEAEPSVYVAGEGTFQDDLLRLAGARNAARVRGFAMLSRETMAKTVPDLVLVGDAAEAAAMRRRLGAGPRIEVMPRDILVRAGPRLGDGLLWLSRAVRGVR